jgi:hypothetical protein
LNKLTAAAAIAGLSSLATFANAGIDMNHTNPQGSNLGPMAGFGVNQIFEAGFATFNGATIDDFTASGSNITRVQVAFEATTAGGQVGISGYHLAIWSSVAAAASSGNTLTGDVLNADFTAAQATLTSLAGTGATGAGGAWLADISGLNIGGLTAGTTYYMGLVAKLDFTPNGQVFILSSTAPAVLGAGTANNSVGVNPGLGFGVGSSVQNNQNAALYIQTAPVPEPASMAVLGMGALALLRRRNKKA